MTLIGMPDVAKRMGVSVKSAKRTLKNAQVPLVAINSRALAVEEDDLAAFLAERSGYAGRGRPGGARNKPKEIPEGESES
jgi:hypothetical protein